MAVIVHTPGISSFVGTAVRLVFVVDSVENGMDQLSVNATCRAVFFVAGVDQFGPGVTIFFMRVTFVLWGLWGQHGLAVGKSFTGPTFVARAGIVWIVFSVDRGATRYYVWGRLVNVAGRHFTIDGRAVGVHFFIT